MSIDCHNQTRWYHFTKSRGPNFTGTIVGDDQIPYGNVASTWYQVTAINDSSIENLKTQLLLFLESLLVRIHLLYYRFLAGTGLSVLEHAGDAIAPARIFRNVQLRRRLAGTYCNSNIGKEL
jgi:hypothetical protein